jgi:methylphosphotriester-DNA--protein-cysteine methyltransferase
MLSLKLIKQMTPPRYNNNPQLELAMQQMIETQTQLTQLVTQNLINNNSELPSGFQQLLDAHTHIVHMMPQSTVIRYDTQPQKNHDS